MVNYNNGKIYKIEAVNGEEHEIYIGSTTKKLLCSRMVAHRHDYNSSKLNPTRAKLTSFTMFDKYGIDNCNIVLLEDFPCSSRDALTSRESHYIRTLKCINKYVPHQTVAEYYEKNKDIMSAKRKAKRYTCECGSEIRVCCKIGHCKSKKHMDFIANISP